MIKHSLKLKSFSFCFVRKNFSLFSINNTYNCRNFSRFSSNLIMTGSETFKISDYTSIGFDLDNTLLRYNVKNMMQMEYEVLSKFLIEKRGYSREYLEQPIDLDYDFIQKGLILDFQKGNILKLGPDGIIQKACHGTNQLDDEEIIFDYGIERRWSATDEFCSDFLVAWNGPLAEQFRTVLDYFDMPAALVFARIIDSIDEKQLHNKKPYKIWPDILDGLMEMYSREYFDNNRSIYFQEMKSNPEKFIHKTNGNVIEWLKELRKTKSLYLLTGSHIDFANLTASYALGKNWRDLFDVVICYAKKPGFFSNNRPFYKIQGIEESDTLKRNELQLNMLYSQGNWLDLAHLLDKKNKTGVENSRGLYIGDNLIQDVYTPAKYSNYDTISISEEMTVEDGIPSLYVHSDYDVLKSEIWGSYFKNDDGDPTLWADLIKKYSKICVPTIDVVAQKPINYEFKCFCESQLQCGYYPLELGLF